MCGSLTQRDLHTFFVSSHLVSLTTYLHIIHHVGRALFGWRSFSLRAKEARAENTNNAREEEEDEREKSGRARRKAGPIERGKAPDEEDECDDDDIPQ